TGDFLIPVGEALAARDGDRWRDANEAEWLPPVRAFAIDAMMDLIRADLSLMGVNHDVFSSERELVAAGSVDEALDALKAQGLIYTGVLEPPKGKLPDDWEERPQTLFKASEFGDDTDRPLMKSDGSWTYFASDLAYHRDKYRRGFPVMIDVWGADHGGYVKRVAAGIKALTGDEGELDVKLCQMVRLLEDGEPAKMSKRAGTFVTLRDLVEAVGKDVVRFIMLTRKNDAPLDFDLVKVREQSRDNPVFYVQYAHARCHSVARMAADAFPDADFGTAALRDADLDRLTDSDELALIRSLAAWPRTVEGAAEAHEPHRLAFYLYDLASAFHSLWSKAREEPGLRFVVSGDAELTRARMALVRAVQLVVASGLGVMGVTPVEELRE
ncbi:MAG: arginine--tRNA ligase, partial [Alphaproteobacteria bacterium]|nr:arginine--tRNA ligase [Alphaproteobacteria bacterium]